MKGAGLSAVQRRWGMRQEGPCYVGGYYFQPSGQKSKKMMPEWKRKQERKIVSPKQWPRSCKEWSRLNMVLFSKAYGPNTTILFELFKTFNYTDITKKKKKGWELQKSPSASRRKCFSSLNLRTASMLHWLESSLRLNAVTDFHSPTCECWGHMLLLCSHMGNQLGRLKIYG